jgi:hypothetical protein
VSIQANSIGTQIERVGKGRCEGAVARPRFSVDQLRAFKPILSFLNSKDRDILYLVFVSGKKQKDVQEILGRSQPSLCYDIKRIRKRLQFIFYLNSVFDIFLEFVASPPDGFEPFEVEVLLLMFYTSSFTMTSDILSDSRGKKVSQVKVRYSFDSCLRRMEEMEMWEMYEIFMVVRNNLNLVRRVYRGGSSDSILREVFVPQ